MLKRHMNLVLALNPIEEGLNFIVPKDWWNELLRNNMHLHDNQQINLPDNHPLQFLSEIGAMQPIIKHRSIPHQDLCSIKSLDSKAQRAANYLNEQIRALKKKEQEMGNKRTQQGFELQHFQKLTFADHYSKILLCPLVNQSMLDLLCLNIEWKVMTPQLYELVCSKKAIIAAEGQANCLVGIAVFIKNEDLGIQINNSCKRQMDYALDRQTPFSAYFHSGQSKYGMVGYVQSKLTYGEMRRYLSSGLMNLQGLNRNNNRQTISFVDDSVFSNVPSISNILPKFFPLQKLNQIKIISNVSLIDFSFTDPSQNDHRQLFHQKNANKKLKPNPPLAASYALKASTTNKPIIISSKVDRLKERMNKFNKIKKQNPLFFNQHLQQQNHGFITIKQQEWIDSVAIMLPTYCQTPNQRMPIEEETRSQDSPNSHKQQLQPIAERIKIDQNRIEHSMWNKQFRHKQLIKRGRVKVDGHIPIPNSNHDERIKTKSNVKVYISHRCNKIGYNKQGDLIQQQDLLIEQQKQATSEITEYLEKLALEVTGKKKSLKLEYVCKEGKDQFEVQSQTCKHDFEDLQQESRQC